MPTKHVFRPGEIVALQSRMIIGQGLVEEKKPAEVEEVEEAEVPEYTGPTADELRREAEAFKASWEQERAEMLNTARTEAAAIIKEAEAAAFEEARRKSNEALKIRKEAEDASGRLIAESERKVAELEAQAGARL